MILDRDSFARSSGFLKKFGSVAEMLCVMERPWVLVFTLFAIFLLTMFKTCRASTCLLTHYHTQKADVVLKFKVVKDVCPFRSNSDAIILDSLSEFEHFDLILNECLELLWSHNRVNLPKKCSGRRLPMATVWEVFSGFVIIFEFGPQ